jgi:hypothetical protein
MIMIMIVARSSDCLGGGVGCRGGGFVAWLGWHRIYYCYYQPYTEAGFIYRRMKNLLSIPVIVIIPS